MIDNWYTLLLIIPLVLFLWWVLRKNFVPDTYMQPEAKKKRAFLRIFLGITRTLMIVLLVIAFAGPTMQYELFLETNPEIQVFVDESPSMAVIDTSGVEAFLDELDSRVPTRVRRIGLGEQSALGDELLSYLEPGENFLVITDGHITSGPSLQDVATFARTINATLNAIDLSASQFDAAVKVIGPQKAVEQSDTQFTISVSSTREDPVPVDIYINDELVEQTSITDSYIVTQGFPVGEVVIRAEISQEDFIATNNVYVHTTTIVDRPRILYVTEKRSGIEEILSSLYSVQQVSSVPEDLSPYYSIILNDVPASRIRNQQAVSSYLLEGNGLFVVGGERSYNNGAYQNTLLETILPVQVGSAQRTQGGANIVVAIDLSGSTRGAVEYQTVRNEDGVTVREVQTTEETQSLQKALAISLIETLNPSNNVGVLGFVYPTPTSPYGCSGACVIRDVLPLGNTKEELIGQVARVDLNGGTSLQTGMEGAIEMLSQVPGSKNIVFISDGISAQLDRDQALNAARAVAAQGGRVYAVQVGDSSQGALFMQRLAQAGNGAYFKADDQYRLSVLFGEPVSIEQGDAFDIFALNQYHFITRDLEIDATLYGYNSVVPKQGATQLVTSNGGDPVLTVWEYGLGRVAALTAFNGPDLGELYTEPTSELLTRTINYAIGDPERKSEVVVNIDDGTVNSPVVVEVRSERLPLADSLAFSPVSTGVYQATTSHEQTGLYEVLGSQYAINYDREFQNVGVSETLVNELAVSGGSMFALSDVDGVIEHVKTLQSLTRVEDVDFRWPFILAVLVIVVIEVLVRRFYETRAQ